MMQPATSSHRLYMKQQLTVPVYINSDITRPPSKPVSNPATPDPSVSFHVVFMGRRLRDNNNNGQITGASEGISFVHMIVIG